MKMTALAFGVKCGGLGARGLTNDAGVAAAARLKNPSAESRPVRATAPNPPPVSQRNSRRVRRQNWRSGVMVGSITAARGYAGARIAASGTGLIEIHKLVRVQRQQAIQPQRVGLGRALLLAQLADERHVLRHL